MREAIWTVRYHQHGNPSEVLCLEQQEIPLLRPNQVRVEMRAAPIHPADINTIEGKYGKLPQLPAICGHEGAGVIIEKGQEVRGLEIGQHVRPIPGIGTWREALVVDANQVLPLPVGLTDEQAAILSVNPGTAWHLLKDFALLKPGDWVIQNAANSSVGRYVVQLAHYWGIRSINIVRRPELIDDLKSQGADHVLISDSHLPKIVRELTQNANIRLGLNAVGGLGTLQLLKCLSRGGTMVTYGAMARRPVVLPAGLLIFKELRCCGFWMTAWYERAQPQEMSQMFGEIASLFQRDILKETIEARYLITQFASAVEHAQRSGRQGKVMFVFNS